MSNHRSGHILADEALNHPAPLTATSAERSAVSIVKGRITASTICSAGSPEADRVRRHHRERWGRSGVTINITCFMGHLALPMHSDAALDARWVVDGPVWARGWKAVCRGSLRNVGEEGKRGQRYHNGEK